MGDVQSLVLQAGSPMGSQVVDEDAHQLGTFGVCLWAAGVLIRVCTHLGLQVWAPRLLIRVPTSPGALGLCVQAAWPLIWVPTDLGFRCVLGLLIWYSQSRG